MNVVCCYIFGVFSRECPVDCKSVLALQRYEYIAILAKVVPRDRSYVISVGLMLTRKTSVRIFCRRCVYAGSEY